MDGEIDHDDGTQKGSTPLLPKDICKAFRAQSHEITDLQLEVIRELKNDEEFLMCVGLPVHPPVSSLRHTRQAPNSVAVQYEHYAMQPHGNAVGST
jgi:hypothetical protein